MIPYDFGDIVLVAFPFTNLAHAKKRPALVLADLGDEDLLLALITSENSRNNADLAITHWKEYGLLLPSVVRLSKMASLQKKMVLKKLGKIGSPDRRKIRSLLKKLFNLS